MHRLIAPESIQTCEWIIKDDNLARTLCVLFEFCKKESERKGAAVAGT